MASSSSIIFALFLLFHSYPSTVQCRNHGLGSSPDDPRQSTYIIHVSPIDVMEGSDSIESYYKSFLPTTVEGSTEARLVYSYTEVFSGFAARLTEHEVDEMAKKEGFVRAYPNEIIPLLTTHTPTFLGLQSGTRGGIWNTSSFGEGVIVGLLDTGIVPGHPSFSDKGMPPPPKRWKGTCQFEGGCNNKLIGARGYSGGPLDTIGHGSHTASTAAGSSVSDVDAFELGSNVASGVAPKAHLAMYKVCDVAGCRTADILAGLDDAVKDGVDVLSLSLGSISQPYQDDPIAIGSFGATQKGILVVCAGGNDGPFASSLSNEAPWIFTVAASSIDRSFRSTVQLGNGKKYNGETLYQPTNFSGTFPLVFTGGDADNPVSDCSTLGTVNAKGKIVVCQSGSVAPKEKSQMVQEAGGVGMIELNRGLEGYTIMDSDYVIPTVRLSYSDSFDVVSYVKSTSSPKASITFNGTVLGTSPSPTVAYFSSRGPSQPSPGILKPDICAPGLNILAAWHEKVDTSEGKFGFNIISGTSMATPHVSGIAALLKSLHPDWSPAAIKSAILTSSDENDRDGNPIKDEQHLDASFYIMGAGHVNPSKAAEPGLVYDLGVDDYIGFLCGLGLGDGLKNLLRQPNASCDGVKNITEFNLNYPSITVPSTSRSATVTRTVTNVGAAKSKYTVEIDVPKGIVASVEPKVLQFMKVNEKKTFTLKVSSSLKEGGVPQGNLRWVSATGKVVVRSPIVIINNGQSSP